MNPDLKGACRLIRSLLLLACAGCLVAADNTWTSSISLESVSSANWFSNDAQNDPVDQRIVLEQLPEIRSSMPQLSLAHPQKNLVPARPFDVRTLDPSPREITSAWITQNVQDTAAQSDTGYSPPPYAGPGIASLVQPADVASNYGKISFIAGAPRPQVSSPAAVDPTWIGPSFGSWSNPGNWSPAGVPNGPGVIVNFQPSGSGLMATTQNVSTGVTVGRLSLEGTGPTTWHIQLSTEITFNNNGNGAVLSNVNTAVGVYALVFPTDHPMILADNLAITNSSGSTNISGSMILASIITGTGNITFNNVSNNRTAGQIALTPIASSTFIGISTIASGAVTFSNNSAFGGAGNQIVLGSSGGGSATLVSTGTGNNLANPILVASGSGGTLTLGSTSLDMSVSSTFSGSITLNGDVALLNPTSTAAATIFSNTISGVGGITKVGAGAVLLAGNNNFTGATTINQGTLMLNAVNALGGTSSITVNSGGTLILSGPTGSTANRIKDSAELILNGNGVGSPQVMTGGLSEHGATNNTAGIGALTLQSSSIIDLGGGSSIIAFANSSAKTWTGTLSIYNYNGSVTGSGHSQIYFGSDVTGLTLAQLSQISFYSGDGTGFLGTGAWGTELDGEVVPIFAPIPEPSTWIGGALGAAGTLFCRRRARKLALT